VLCGLCGICGSGICGEHGPSGGRGGRCGCGTHARRSGRSPNIQRESLLRIEQWEVVKMLQVDIVKQHPRKRVHKWSPEYGLSKGWLFKDLTILHFIYQNTGEKGTIKMSNIFA